MTTPAVPDALLGTYTMSLKASHLPPSPPPELTDQAEHWTMKITTSGVYSHAALSAAIDAIGVENVMFAVDYPYESNERAVEFLTTAPLDADDLARVAHRNADELLRLASAPSLP